MNNSIELIVKAIFITFLFVLIESWNVFWILSECQQFATLKIQFFFHLLIGGCLRQGRDYSAYRDKTIASLDLLKIEASRARKFEILLTSK